MSRLLRSLFRRPVAAPSSDKTGAWTLSDIEFYLHKLAGQVGFQHNRREDIIRGPMLTQFQFEHEDMGFIGGVQNRRAFFIFIADKKGGATKRYPLEVLLSDNADIKTREFCQESFDLLTAALPKLIEELSSAEREATLDRLDAQRKK